MSWPQVEHARAGAHALPVLATWSDGGTTEPGVGHRYHVYPLAPELAVLGGRGGLVCPLHRELGVRSDVAAARRHGSRVAGVDDGDTSDLEQ